MDGMGNINQVTAEVPEHKPFGLDMKSRYRIDDVLQLLGLFLEITVVVFGLFPQKNLQEKQLPQPKNDLSTHTIHVWYIYIPTFALVNVGERYHFSIDGMGYVHPFHFLHRPNIHHFSVFPM